LLLPFLLGSALAFVRHGKLALGLLQFIQGDNGQPTPALPRVPVAMDVCETWLSKLASKKVRSLPSC